MHIFHKWTDWETYEMTVHLRDRNVYRYSYIEPEGQRRTCTKCGFLSVRIPKV